MRLGAFCKLLVLATFLAACQPQAPGSDGPATAPPSAYDITPEADAQMGAAYDNLSDSDRSTLAAILQQPTAALLTTEGSPNDRFWSLLVAQAWAKPAPVDPQILEGLPTARSYAFVRGGRDKLITWLRAHLEQTRT